MKSKIPFKWTLSVVGMTGIMFSVVFAVVLFPSVQAEGYLVTAPPISGTMQLKIPKLNVDALVESVGLTTEGAMDVPQEPANAAWFNLGPRPGSVGTSVIDGHSGLKEGKRAVFDNLNKLEKGDKIYVEDLNGTTTTFVVREVRVYDKNADASDVFASKDAESHLNLITCSGAWNELEKTHADRLVVFADKE